MPSFNISYCTRNVSCCYVTYKCTDDNIDGVHYTHSPTTCRRVDGVIAVAYTKRMPLHAAPVRCASPTALWLCAHAYIYLYIYTYGSMSFITNAGDAHCPPLATWRPVPYRGKVGVLRCLLSVMTSPRAIHINNATRR